MSATRPAPPPELYTIPLGDAYIVYRPLLRTAFVGNAAMARCAAAPGVAPAGTDTPAEAFLQAAGFRDPDPPAPRAPSRAGARRPTMAVLLMTSDCNLRCTYCYARGGETAALKMTMPLARQAIDAAVANARAAGRKRWSLVFHGPGEPTTNWRVLVDAVEYARSQPVPCRISMSTNGVFGRSKLDFVLRHFSSVNVSVDGVADVQDAQRPRADGTGSFAAVARTMRALDAARFRYGVRMTATPPSFGRLPESVAWLCANTRCRSIQVEPAYCAERGRYQDPTPEQVTAFVDAFIEAFEVAARAGRELTYSGARPWLVTASFCRAPEDALVVTPEGDLVACFETHDRRHALLGQFALGRLGAAGVQFDQARVAAFRAQQEQLREACRGCFCYWHCGGDCTVKRLSFDALDRGRCEVNRAVTRELLAWYIAAGDGIWRAGPTRPGATASSAEHRREPPTAQVPGTCRGRPPSHSSTGVVVAR